jgi:DNA-binding MarR family transcriptional regulator
MEWAAEAVDPFGLTLPQFAALALVQRFDGISQSGIGERLGLSKAAVSGIAMSLEQQRLLVRRQHMLDPGRRALYVTQAGAELVAAAADRLARVDARFLDRVGEEAIEALAKLPPRNLSAIEIALLYCQ